MVPTTGATSLDIVLVALLGFLIDYVIKWKRPVPKGLRLPPGPRGRPIIGNLADMPTHHEWETFTRWGEQYGELVCVNLLGTLVIFVNSMDAAFDDLDQHHGIYALRTAMAAEPGLLRRILDSPNSFVDHMKHCAASIIMEVVYDIEIRSEGDRYIEIAHKALEGASAAATPGTFLVDLLPSLEYVPEWMPGGGFKKQAKIWRQFTVEMCVAPFMVVKNKFLAGTAGQSIMTSCLADLSHNENAPADEEDVILNVGGVTYAAGAGTTVSALVGFVLAMVLKPEVQRKAQAELDSVVGDRLPTFEDSPQLPYTNALCAEVLRWRPVAPLGIAHAVSQDDVYGEYFIPKGSFVVGNAWAILHNEATYGPRPEEFEPERFLRPGVDIPSAQFGFGRRLCPGRYMAENTLFLVAASILKVFSITHAKDASGKEIPVNPLYTSGAVIQPEPFVCSIRPRSESARKIILEHVSD